jgi:hypothetical protein
MLIIRHDTRAPGSPSPHNTWLSLELEELPTTTYTVLRTIYSVRSNGPVDVTSQSWPSSSGHGHRTSGAMTIK